jgi:hypothetical protein
MTAYLKSSELKTLPFTTLSVLALAVSQDIEAGDEDKRPLLEQILVAMQPKYDYK